MTLTADFARQVFQGLESSDGAAFFAHVADDVDWTVMGTHPLAGHYHSKAEFLGATFAKLGKVLREGARLSVENLIVSGDDVVAELKLDAVAKNGLRFDNGYCWVAHFENGVIVRVRAYLDSALVARVFEENPLG